MKRSLLLFLSFLFTVSVQANHWEPDPHQFPNNMSVIGVIEINGVEQASESYELGAFCGDECRGSEMLAFYEGLNRYMVFILIYGEPGDVLSFRLYDHAIQQELELSPAETMQFVPNGIVGTIPDPYVFSFSGSVGIGLITVNAVPEEGGTVTGGGAYWIGETCTLQAMANEGYSFVDWTENGEQVSSEPMLSFLVDGNRDLQANFMVNSYEITLEVQPDEGGTVSGNGNYDFGTMATVSAAPHEHYEFDNWSEDGVAVSNSAEYTFLVNRNRHLVATFVLEKYVVNASAFPENAGFIEGVGNYTYGQTATLIAHPNENYEFVGWTEEGHYFSSQPSICFVVTQDKNLEAHFSYVEGVEETGTILSVSPNPTSGIVIVQGARESDMIHVMDVNGRVVLTKKCERTETTLDLGFVPEGWYTLMVRSEGKMHVVKLIRALR